MCSRDTCSHEVYVFQKHALSRSICVPERRSHLFYLEETKGVLLWGNQCASEWNRSCSGIIAQLFMALRTRENSVTHSHMTDNLNSFSRYLSYMFIPRFSLCLNSMFDSRHHNCSYFHYNFQSYLLENTNFYHWFMIGRRKLMLPIESQTGFQFTVI